jgi:uncharacterized UPF0160 family protein
VIECRDPASLTKEDEKYLIVATHSGKFHADDVMCLALVSLFSSKPVVLIRTRDEDVFSKCHMVLDVGKKDFYGKHHLRLDHHQTAEDYIINGQVASGTKDKLYYKNGIKKAACGKLADWMFSGISDSFLEFFRSKVLYQLEAKDNGISLTGRMMRDINNNPYPFGFIPSMNPSEKECRLYGISVAARTCFIKAEEMTKQIVMRYIEEYEQVIEDKQTVENMCEEAVEIGSRYIVNEDCPMVNISDHIFQWNKTKSNKNKRIRSFMQKAIGEDDIWVVRAIPKPDGGFYKSIPSNWKGKSKIQLENLSKYKSIQFCSGSSVVFGDRIEAERFTKKLAEK